MAIGDAASTAGLTVFSPTADLRKGYENANVRGDELAAHITDGVHPFTRITGQATSAQIANHAVTKVKTETVIEDASTGAAATGWSSVGLNSRAYVHLRTVNIALRVRRTGAAIVPNASGGIADTLVFMVDAAYRPSREVSTAGLYKNSSGGTYMALFTLQVGGEVLVRCLMPGASLAPTLEGEEAIRVDFTFVNP